MFSKDTVVGVLGAGSMGAGIAQVAATAGHKVVLVDSNGDTLHQVRIKMDKLLKSLVEKGKMDQNTCEAIFGRIDFAIGMNAFENCGLIIEAIVENLEIKQNVFAELESIVSKETILASNTSSLSIVSIASACKYPDRVLGLHFFNPAPLMPLVEVIPALTTDEKVVLEAKSLIDSWGKTTVIAKDTPGFIVNRVARPFYGEAIRILEEGIADVATIDWAMKEFGGFRMGPFELMDYIGNDINYTVTETIFKEFFYDPRYKPSFTQKRMCEAKHLGRKSGKGYYDYSENAVNPEPNKDRELGEGIFFRIIVMLINEAADALYLRVATRDDLDLAMTKGVNYPKGLLKWADEMEIDKVLKTLRWLEEEYGEDRYRPSVLLKQMSISRKSFY